MIGDAFHEAGWPAYPIVALGITALVLALRHAAAPTRGGLTLVVGLSIACVVMGVFGTTVGFQHAIEGTRDLAPEQRWLAIVGLKEALNCLGFALVLVLPATLAATIGQWRLRSTLDEIAARS